MNYLRSFIKQNFSNRSILKTKYFLGLTGIPKTLRIDITAFCNAKCPFCPRIAMPNERAAGKMSTASFISIVKEAKNYGINIIKLYITSEPLLHPQFSEFIDIAYDHGINVHISTNLSVLQHRLSDLNKVDKLQLSIEGWDKDSYEKYRFPLKFERARDNFNFLINDKSLKNIYKEIHLPVTKKTNLKSFFKLWGDVNTIRIDFMQPYNDFNKIKEAFESKYPDKLKSEIYYLEQTKDKTCYDPFDEIVIGFDGKIHLCCLDFHANLPLGNISDGFSNVLKNLKRKSIQKEFLSGNIDTCKDCSQFRVPSDSQKKLLSEIISNAWLETRPKARIIFFDKVWER